MVWRELVSYWSESRGRGTKHLCRVEAMRVGEGAVTWNGSRERDQERCPPGAAPSRPSSTPRRWLLDGYPAPPPATVHRPSTA